MLKYLFSTIVCFLLFTFLTKCDTTHANNVELSAVEIIKSSTDSKNLILKTLPLKKVNTSTLKLLDNWTAFHVLKNEITKMVENTPSIFELQKNDIKQLFINLEINTPELLNTKNIWARIKVLETNAHKFHEAKLNYQKGSEQIKKTKNNTLRAYNIFIHQINKRHEKYSQLITKKEIN